MSYQDNSQKARGSGSGICWSTSPRDEGSKIRLHATGGEKQRSAKSLIQISWSVFGLLTSWYVVLCDGATLVLADESQNTPRQAISIAENAFIIYLTPFCLDGYEELSRITERIRKANAAIGICRHISRVRWDVCCAY